MKLQPHELFAALHKLVDKIEACGASTELTDAVVFATDIMSATGNEHNPANEFAAKRVLEAIGPVEADSAAEPPKTEWTLPDFGEELDAPVNTLHLIHRPGHFDNGTWVPADHISQEIALKHFSSGCIAISYAQLDEIIYVAGLHGWKVTTEGDPNANK